MTVTVHDEDEKKTGAVLTPQSTTAASLRLTLNLRGSFFGFSVSMQTNRICNTFWNITAGKKDLKAENTIFSCFCSVSIWPRHRALWGNTKKVQLQRGDHHSDFLSSLTELFRRLLLLFTDVPLADGSLLGCRISFVTFWYIGWVVNTSSKLSVEMWRHFSCSHPPQFSLTQHKAPQLSEDQAQVKHMYPLGLMIIFSDRNL